MKPTLYAEDVDQMISDMHHPGFGAVIRALDAYARILPRRCPDPDCYDGLTMRNVKQGEVDHRRCDGHGFLYPDPPEWWKDRWDGPKTQGDWELVCRDLWRLFGIVEVER